MGQAVGHWGKILGRRAFYTWVTGAPGPFGVPPPVLGKVRVEVEMLPVVKEAFFLYARDMPATVWVVSWARFESSPNLLEVGME